MGKIKDTDMANEKSLSLYDITAEEMRIIDALVEGGGELTPELEAAMEALKENKMCKVDSYYNVYMLLDAETEVDREQEEIFAKRRRTAERGKEWLKEGLLHNMDALGISVIKGKKHEVRRRANPGRIVFDEEAVLRDPMRYIDKVREYLPEWVKLKVEVSKSRLKEAFQKGGQPFDESVRIEESNTVTFK